MITLFGIKKNSSKFSRINFKAFHISLVCSKFKIHVCNSIIFLIIAFAGSILKWIYVLEFIKKMMINAYRIVTFLSYLFNYLNLIKIFWYILFWDLR